MLTTERLCKKSRDRSKEFRVIDAVGFDHLVESDQELAHGGGDDDFEGFSRVGEAFGELLEAFAVFDGVERRHVQGVADRLSSALDAAFAAARSGVVGQRGDARPAWRSAGG